MEYSMQHLSWINSERARGVSYVTIFDGLLNRLPHFGESLLINFLKNNTDISDRDVAKIQSKYVEAGE